MDNRFFGISVADYPGNRKSIDELITALNDTYGSMGLSVKINYENDRDTQTLLIRIDDEVVNRTKTRGAGRPKKYIQPYKCQDIVDMQQTMTADQIAQKLGISKSTYFRRLKAMREYKDMDWYF